MNANCKMDISNQTFCFYSKCQIGGIASTAKKNVTYLYSKCSNGIFNKTPVPYFILISSRNPQRYNICIQKLFQIILYISCNIKQIRAWHFGRTFWTQLTYTCVIWAVERIVKLLITFNLTLIYGTQENLQKPQFL